MSQELSIPREVLLQKFFENEEDLMLGRMTIKDFDIKPLKEGVSPKIKTWSKDYQRILPTYKLIKDLSSKYSIGLLSDVYKDLIPMLIENDIIPRIDYSYIFLSCDIGIQKPNRGIYDHIMKTVEIKPEEIFFTDDRDQNLLVPSEMGWGTYHFNKKDPQQSVEDLRKLLLP